MTAPHPRRAPSRGSPGHCPRRDLAGGRSRVQHPACGTCMAVRATDTPSSVRAPAFPPRQGLTRSRPRTSTSPPEGGPARSGAGERAHPDSSRCGILTNSGRTGVGDHRPFDLAGLRVAAAGTRQHPRHHPPPAPTAVHLAPAATRPRRSRTSRPARRCTAAPAAVHPHQSLPAIPAPRGSTRSSGRRPARASPPGAHPWAARVKRGSGEAPPQARSAAISPTSGANLAPWPEQGEQTTNGP